MEVIAMERKEIRKQIPAALKANFTDENAEATKVSKFYKFFSTARIIKDFAKLGWVVVGGKNAGSKKDPKLTKHILKFENPEYSPRLLEVGGLKPQIWVTNSHDGTSSLRMHIGLYRLVCSNGLCVFDQDVESFKVRHMGYDFETVRLRINQIVDKLPSLVKQVGVFQKVQLTEKQQLEFATKAIIARYRKDLQVSQHETTIDMKRLKREFKPMELLAINRKEDTGNSLFRVYNRIQENLMKGDYVRYTATGTVDTLGRAKVPKKARAVTQIRTDVLINKEL